MTIEKTPGFSATHSSDKSRSYSRAVDVLSAVGEDIFNLEITAGQQEQWAAMFDGMHYLDDILDSQEPAEIRLAQYDRGIQLIVTGELHGYLDSEAEEALIRLRNSIVTTDAGRLPGLSREAHSIALLGERLRQATDARMLGIIALAEGRVTSRLITVPETGPNHERIAEFNSFLEIIASYSNVVDALFDLKHDAAEDRLILTPSFKNHLELLKISLPGIKSIIQTMDANSLFKLSRLTLGSFGNRQK
jgi:hypothetical protein